MHGHRDGTAVRRRSERHCQPHDGELGHVAHDELIRQRLPDRQGVQHRDAGLDDRHGQRHRHHHRLGHGAPASASGRCRDGVPAGGFRHDDEGTSLLELLVAMTLMAVFMSMFTTAVFMMTSSTNKTDASVNTAGQVNNAFLRLDKLVDTHRRSRHPGPEPPPGTGMWSSASRPRRTRAPVTSSASTSPRRNSSCALVGERRSDCRHGDELGSPRQLGDERYGAAANSSTTRSCSVRRRPACTASFRSR